MTQTNTNNNEHEYQPYFDLLDTMRHGMNMFGAPAKLREIFPEMGRRESIDITTAWMEKRGANDE
tara:strand:+ start:1550 stop:1744 length:195 start_codon:yes stop_codon:yes gene_type:complete